MKSKDEDGARAARRLSRPFDACSKRVPSNSDFPVQIWSSQRTASCPSPENVSTLSLYWSTKGVDPNLRAPGKVRRILSSVQSSISRTSTLTTRSRAFCASLSRAARSGSLHVATPITSTCSLSPGMNGSPTCISENPARATAFGNTLRPVSVRALKRDASSLASMTARSTSPEKSKNLKVSPLGSRKSERTRQSPCRRERGSAVPQRDRSTAHRIRKSPNQ